MVDAGNVLSATQRQAFFKSWGERFGKRHILIFTRVVHEIARQHDDVRAVVRRLRHGAAQLRNRSAPIVRPDVGVRNLCEAESTAHCAPYASFSARQPERQMKQWLGAVCALGHNIVLYKPRPNP